MGDPTRSFLADLALSLRPAPRAGDAPLGVRSRRSGRRWTALGMAFCAIAAATSASARSLWDDPAFALYQKAVEAINKKDYDAATRLAGEAIQQYPTHVLAYYLRGQAAIARSSWEAAAADLGKATELYPGSFAAQRDLGLAYQQLGRIDDAARAWQAAMALRPDDDDMRVRLAFMLLKADKEEPARALLKELAARDTRIPEVWTALGRLAYEENDLPATEQAFVRALALKDDGRTWFNLAVVRMRQDNRAGAMEAFERAAKHPETKEQAGKEIDKLRAGGTAERPAARGDVQQQPGVSTVQPARRGY